MVIETAAEEIDIENDHKNLRDHITEELNERFTAQADPTRSGAEPEGDPTKAPLTGDPTKAEPEARDRLDKLITRFELKLKGIKS